MTLLAARFDKKCGKSGIPDNAKCTKKTTAKATSTSKASLQENYYKVAGGVQTALALRSLAMGNRRGALRNLKRAAVSGSEVLEERAERTGNKRLLQFSAAKNAVESATSARSAVKSFQQGNLKAASFNLLNAANTGFEASAFRAQSQGQSLSAFRERNRTLANTLQKAKIAQGLVSIAEPSARAGINLSRRKKAREAARQQAQTARLFRDPQIRARGGTVPGLKYDPSKWKKDSLWAVGFKVDAGPNLSVGRGEKQSVEKGGGLTAKGRAKYNRQTGSNLKAPVTGKVKPGSKAAKRRKSFCARSRSWTGERGKAARRRWKC